MKEENHPENHDSLEERLDRDIEAILSGKRENPGEIYFLPSLHREEVLRRITRKIHTSREPRLLWLRQVAAVLIPLLILNITAWLLLMRAPHTDQYREIRAERGDKLIVVLPDGSRVWLNADSQLRYPARFSSGERSVTLSGEAYFEVEKDERNPFKVQAGDVEIRVLGTRFNVTAYDDESRITSSLEQGFIRVSTPSSAGSGFVLSPGQTAVYSRADGHLEVTATPDHLKDTGWKNDILRFCNTPMAEVLRRIERRYDIGFELNDQELNRFTYTFVSEDETVEEILAGMKAITPISWVKLNKHKYLIHRSADYRDRRTTPKTHR